MLKEARAKTLSSRVRDDFRKSLRHLTNPWLKPVSDATQDRIVEGGDPEQQHTYSQLSKSGEMNHTGQHLCDHCDGEMQILKGEGEGDVYWQCSRCNRQDNTSFRICNKCGKKTIPDKWAASAPGMPVSLNAGGCTDCERCVLCDGVLAIGNLRWFYGRWSHNYPSPEYDRRTGEEIMVTRERSKAYAFHAHYSCCEKTPQAVPQIIVTRTPEWFTQGEAEQKRLEVARLRRQGRCLRCKNPLTFWDRIMERDRHRRCR
jgi:hypothetical protein